MRGNNPEKYGGGDWERTGGTELSMIAMADIWLGKQPNNN